MKPIEELETKENEKLIEKLKEIMDPELGIDIWSLGLIYDIKMSDKITIDMTFTSPMCPYGPQIVAEIEEVIKELGKNGEINVVFDPIWKPSQELREMIGI